MAAKRGRPVLAITKRPRKTGKTIAEINTAGHVKGIDIEGIEEVQEILNTLLPRHARNLIKATIQQTATDLKNEIKRNTPERTGNLKQSLKAVRKNSPPDAPVSDVIFETGKKKGHDGFYWRFVEHGTGAAKQGDAKDNKSKGMAPRPFVQPVRDQFAGKMPELIKENFVRKLVKMSEREQRKIAKAVNEYWKS